MINISINIPIIGNRIMLRFVEFDVAISDNCDQDYLEMREENGAGKILGNKTVTFQMYVCFT